MRLNIHSIIELVALKMLESAPVCCNFISRGRSLALYKKRLKIFLGYSSNVQLYIIQDK